MYSEELSINHPRIKMAEKQLSKTERKRERQTISIPFIWELKPGLPKKDWKPDPIPVPRTDPPVKLIVSVPFGWEEKPGTPLLSCMQPAKESHQRAHSITLSSPPISSDHEDEGYWSAGDVVIDEQMDDEQDGLTGSESKMYSNNYGDSSSFQPRLLANGLISKTAVSDAVPVQQTSLALVPVNYEWQQGPGSPASETDTATNSCVTRSASLAGASFLEWLFPLLVPNSSFLDKVGRLENDPSHKPNMMSAKLLEENNCSQVEKPLLTLGELILMSRRRSHQRKNLIMHKQQPRGFAESDAYGCFVFGSGTGISGLHRKWKRHLQPKLVQMISI